MHLDLTSKTRGNPMCRVDVKGCNSKHSAEKQKKHSTHEARTDALLMYDFFWWTPRRRQHGLFRVTKEPLQPLLFECLPSPSFLLPSLLLGNAYELPASVQSFDVESPFCWSSHAIFPHFHQARRQRPAGREKKKVTAALNESKPTMSRCLESMSSKSLESTSRCTFKTYLNKYIDHDYLWMEFLGIPLASINSASAFHFTRSSLELSICWPSLTRSASRKSTVKIFWCKPQYVVLKTLKTYSLLLDQQKYIHWAPCYIGEAIYKQKKI